MHLLMDEMSLNGVGGALERRRELVHRGGEKKSTGKEEVTFPQVMGST